MNETEIKELFLEFWRDSYPASPPGVHAIRTHAAFGAFLLERLEQAKGED